MNTLFDKIWDSHIVSVIDGGPTQLYIDRLYCHEVTSPQAFEGIRKRGCGILRPGPAARVSVPAAEGDGSGRVYSFRRKIGLI